MDLPSDLASHLRDLAESISTGDNALTHSLETLVVDLRTAVSSYVGLRMTVVLDGWPVTLTAFSAVDGVRPVTSFRLNVSSQGPGAEPDIQVVFYAGTPGAFVDLAADLNYLHRQDQELSDGDGQRPAAALDIDLPPITLVSGVTGLAEYGTINRAVGALIARGRDPDEALDTLHRDAATCGLALHVYADRLLNETAPTTPKGHP